MTTTTSGTAVADLLLHRRLATGALCSVYEAHAAAIDRRVAFKRMHREHLADPGLVGRCLNEALMLQALLEMQADPKGADAIVKESRALTKKSLAKAK